jgi:ANTAR domain
MIFQVPSTRLALIQASPLAGDPDGLIASPLTALRHGFQITPDEAFERLVALSQRSNTKVRDVARRLVEARSTPPI